MTCQLVVLSTAVMTTLLALAAFWELRIVVFYVLISLALAATLRPLVKAWSKRGWVMRVGLILLFIISVCSLGFLILLDGQSAVEDIQKLTLALSVQDTWNLPSWLQASGFQQAVFARLPPPSKFFEGVTGDQGQLVLPAILGFTQDIGNILSAVLLILFLSIYWSINQNHFERLWLSLLPSEQRKHARDIWRTIEPHLGAYIRSEIVQSLLATMLLSLGYWLLGAPYPTLLALIGALAWLVPIVGAALALILPLLIGLLINSMLGSVMVVYTLIILIGLQIWVEPHLFRRKWDNPILTLIMLLAMADAFGLIGILIAPPLSAVCQIIWNILISNRLAAGAAIQIADLKERQAHLQVMLAEMHEPPPLVASSLERLSELLDKAEPILQAALPAEESDIFHARKTLDLDRGKKL